jgi:hypothetical protein
MRKKRTFHARAGIFHHRNFSGAADAAKSALGMLWFPRSTAQTAVKEGRGMHNAHKSLMAFGEFHERLHTRVAVGESSETIRFTQSCEERSKSSGK